jgi:hypothetical protein
MADEPRRRAKVAAALGNVSAGEHQTLKDRALALQDFWGKPPDADKPLLAKFRQAVKDYYLLEQLRRCCYCSAELVGGNRTFDAEHILDKKTYPEFMFNLANIAVACARCNTRKSKRKVLHNDHPRPTTVPAATADYLLVHPHLDEWSDHLMFGEFRRISPRGGSAKGKETVRICGLDALNAARMADELVRHLGFEAAGAEKALDRFFKLKRRSLRLQELDYLQELAEAFELEVARDMVTKLRHELDPPEQPDA